MKKTTIIALLLTAPIVIFSLFAKDIKAQKPIYLHKKEKKVRSSMEHLNKFADKGLVVLDFYADWCNPCKRMSPLIDAAAASLSQFTFIKINRDFFMDLAKTFNITSIPTLIFLRDGKEIGRYDGDSVTQNQLEQLIITAFNK